MYMEEEDIGDSWLKFSGAAVKFEVLWDIDNFDVQKGSTCIHVWNHVHYILQAGRLYKFVHNIVIYILLWDAIHCVKSLFFNSIKRKSICLNIDDI